MTKCWHLHLAPERFDFNVTLCEDCGAQLTLHLTHYVNGLPQDAQERIAREKVLLLRKVGRAHPDPEQVDTCPHAAAAYVDHFHTQKWCPDCGSYRS